MIPGEPSWEERRFFLPNEDAAAVAGAVARCRPPPARPVFVGGSGMVLLQAAAAGGGAIPRATFVDVSAAQLELFEALRRAVDAAADPAALRAWFAAEVHPPLAAYYAARGQRYPPGAVLAAMRDLFGLGFFFDAGDLERARAVARGAAAVEADVVAYLAGCPRPHDFIYLSNVPDYLGPDRLGALFAGCRRHRGAPVYVLVTDAAPDRAAVRAAWEREGFVDHADSAAIDAANRGLGARGLVRPWNRPGEVHLLVPDPVATARAEAGASTRWLRLEE